MISKALDEYEENNYESESDKWQVSVNNLIEKIERRIKNEKNWIDRMGKQTIKGN